MRAVIARILYAVALALLAAHAQAMTDAEKLVTETTDRILAAVERDQAAIRQDPSHLYALVDEIVLPHFDFRRMAQRVLAKHWRGATEAQRDRFTGQFKTLLVRTYATALADYSGQSVELLPTRESARADDVTIRTEVQQPGGMRIPIAYSMYRSGEGWKVYDVAVDGVSLVINYRASFATQIREHGLDGLIERLVQHNERKTP